MADIDPKAGKLLADLLALTLSENPAQGDAALSAIRRRAERDALTGGALKHLVDQLLGSTEAPPDMPSRHEISNMRWRLADQTRELEQARRARQAAEGALGQTKLANASLAERIGGLQQAGRSGRWLGFGAGLVLGVAGLAGVTALTRPAPVVDRGMTQLVRTEVSNFLLSCFLSSSNSLGGTPVTLHLLVDVDSESRVVAARIAPSQTPALDHGGTEYGEMVLRTLTGGGCGALPLPDSLHGKPVRLDLYLPR